MHGLVRTLVALGLVALGGQAHAQVSFIAGTFNIGAGRHGGTSAYNLQWVIDDINGQLFYADVLALQEVQRSYSPDTRCEDQFSKIRTGIAAHFPSINARYAPFPAAPNLWCSWTAPADVGPALFTKHPILRSWTVGLPYSRSAVGAEIQFPTGRAVVYAVHLSHQQAAHRNAQANALVNNIYAMSNGLPVVVLGDFNARAADWELNAFRGALWGPEHSTNLTNQNWTSIPWADDPTTPAVYEGLIDFAFASPWRSGTHVQIGTSWSSDHFPVLLYYYR